MSKSFSVIVPTSDRRRYLEPALGDLIDQSLAADRFEIVVVDDSPGRAEEQLVLALAEATPVRLSYERSGGGRGPNAARNVGIEASDGDVLVFVDDDCRFPRGWLAATAAGIDRSPPADCFGGPIGVWLEPGHPRWCGREPFPITALDRGPADRYVDLVFSANMAIPRSTFERIGGFDPALPIYGDETEWVLRLRREGGLVRYIAGAGVTHTRLAADLSRRGMLASARLRGRRAAELDRAHDLAPPRELSARAAARTFAHALRRGCWSALAHAVEQWSYLARQSRAGLCVAVLAAASLMLGAAAPAGASTPGARLYNLSPAGAPTDAGWTSAQFARLTRGGTDMIRLNISMQGIYRCDPETGRPVLQNPSHPWAAIDKFLAAAQAGDRTKVLGVLIGVPVPCVAPRSASQPLTNTDVWADFVEAAARRYGPSGRDDREATDGDPALADGRFDSDVPIRYWEIHNEPNLEGFWTPSTGADAHSPQEAARYAQYMCAANGLLKRGDPAIQTLNGAPTRGGTGDEPQYLRWLWSSWSKSWWQEWWKSRPASSCHDITAVHAYARVDEPDGLDLDGGVREIADELEAVQRVKADAGIGSQQTWITEFGLGSPDEPEVVRGVRMTVSDADQADFLRQAYERLDDPGVWGPTNLARAFWFSVQDYAAPSQQTRWDLRAGLFRHSAEGATPKPSWTAFVDAARDARPSPERGPDGRNPPLPPPGPGYRGPPQDRPGVGP